MANDVAPIGATNFFTIPVKTDPQTALSERLSKFEKLMLLNQYQAKIEQYKKERASELYA